MKHSNIYYIASRNPENGKTEFTEVVGIAVRNSHSFDLFRYKQPHKSYEAVSEGMTGYKICEIRPGSTSREYISSPKDIDAFLNTYHQIDKIHTFEKMKKAIEQVKNDGRLSHRYTEPDKKRPPKAKETNPDMAYSKCLYEKSKKHFIRIYNENGIQLFKRKDSGNNPHCSVYVPCNGWMIPLGQATRLDEHINSMKEGFDVHAWLVGHFESQIADPNKWVDVGIAEYLNREIEADEHNTPIKAVREEKRRKDDEQRENKRAAMEKDRVDKYDTAIQSAVNAIRNKEAVNNDDIETLTGNVTSVILELMRIYKIEIPLKTKGWINAALARIYYMDDDGAYTYEYYSKSRNSTVFQDYLDKLIGAVSALF